MSERIRARSGPRKGLRLLASVATLIAILACGRSRNDAPQEASEAPASPAVASPSEPAGEGATGPSCDLRSTFGQCWLFGDFDPATVRTACGDAQGTYGEAACPAGELGRCALSDPTVHNPDRLRFYYAAPSAEGTQTVESARDDCENLLGGEWTSS